MKFIILNIKCKFDKYSSCFQDIGEFFSGAIQFKESRNDEKLIDLLIENKYLKRNEKYSIYRTPSMILVKFFNTGHILEDQSCLELITYKNYKSIAYRDEFKEFLKVKPEQIKVIVTKKRFKLSSVVEKGK